MYCCPLWFNSTSSSIKKLKASYNGVLRRLLLIVNLYRASGMYVTHTIPSFYEYGRLSEIKKYYYYYYHYYYYMFSLLCESMIVLLFFCSLYIAILFAVFVIRSVNCHSDVVVIVFRHHI